MGDGNFLRTTLQDENSVAIKTANPLPVMLTDRDGNTIDSYPDTSGNYNIGVAAKLIDSDNSEITVQNPLPVSAASLPLPSGAAAATNQGQFRDVSDGLLYSYKTADGKPRISSMQYMYDIAEGNVTGHTPWSKMGYTPTINTSDSVIWSKSGTYTFCTTAGKWEVVSSDNTQDIGKVIKGDATGNTVQADAGGSTTTLVDADVDFTAATAVAAGDCVILDPHGTTPEWGYVTSVAAHTITCSGGFSSGGTGASRYYAVVDKSAYTHAHVVKLEYLDSSYASHVEIVVLNGTTAVDTVNTDYFRINSFRIIAGGSAGVCKGNLTLRADGAAGDYSYITAGFTRARNSVYTVPAGKTLYIVQFFCGWSTPNDTKFQTARIYVRTNRELSTGFASNMIFYPSIEFMVTNSQIGVESIIPVKVPQKTDLYCGGIAATGGSGPATSLLSGWLE